MSLPAGYIVELEEGRWISRGVYAGNKGQPGRNLANVYKTKQGARTALGMERQASGSKFEQARIYPVGLVGIGVEHLEPWS